MPSAVSSGMDLKPLIRRAVRGDDHAIAELISIAEDVPSSQREIERLLPAGKAVHLIGLTGPPGCGKSTLVDKLISRYRKRGQSVGVIAVDPTSPTTGGAILGDRIRMTNHFTDPGVFIRSMASRGELGGVAKATAFAAKILSACGKDIVLIETVGVGQLEVSVRKGVDSLCVVLTPASGDDIQFMKAGIMEVAHLFVLNKAEDPKSGQIIGLLNEYVRDQFGHSSWHPPVVATVALENKGIDELVVKLDEHLAYLKKSGARKIRGRNSATGAPGAPSRARDPLQTNPEFRNATSSANG